ncbi:hypothetical protein [Klebsiella aerogenes]|uniref:hypothetical protein n=1 Tax=Klebsiella aerogenes TaxID=548 RepID=UPI00063C9D60|nr:hypothetical protein [Klebsiella aerogenes]KLF23669.1 hypothetical protein YA28_04050 [Klebsiella aerogenes]KUQ18832.1 hypothetical protein AWI09_00325 [Klebsiella aerogenes]KUR16138.1 hypothetical protein AWI35_01545 [Klebsiella aerogenes]NPD98159.1 hypothetical protein [Klebsiella aerogenes]UNX72277.1 hypothetical protein MQE09_16190 [Klebsiella aerogenes]
MKHFFLTAMLMTPLFAQANEWNVTCAGVNLTIYQGTQGEYVAKGNDIYPVVGGTTLKGVSYSIYAKYLFGIKGYPDNVVPVDANQSLNLTTVGVDDRTVFRLLDSRGNHECSVKSFKAGE